MLRGALAAAMFLLQVLSAPAFGQQHFDLRPLGYSVAPGVFDDTDIAFISDDILAVSINQKRVQGFGRLGGESPESRLLVFDLRANWLSADKRFSIYKGSGSVRAVSEQRLAILGESVVRFCDAGLVCGVPLPADPELKVSPAGKFVTVGGYHKTEIKVIDTTSLRVTASYAHDLGMSHAEITDTAGHRIVLPQKILQLVSPGDSATAVAQGAKVYLHWLGGKVSVMDFTGSASSISVSFLDSSKLAYLSQRRAKALVIGTDGKQLFEYSLVNASNSMIISSLSGRRFAVYEHGYTALNAAAHALTFGMDVGRPEDLQRVRMIDLTSGAELTKLEWDPKQEHLIVPAISPSGNKIACIRQGFLDVLTVR